jgi:hypothetical protein
LKVPEQTWSLMIAQMRAAAPATEKQMCRLSSALNDGLAAHNYHSWFAAFRHSDAEGVGRLDWSGFVSLVKELLHAEHLGSGAGGGYGCAPAENPTPVACEHVTAFEQA